MSGSLVTVSNGHATMTSPAKTEGGDVLSEAVQEITKTENKPVAMIPLSEVTVAPIHKRILHLYCRICGQRTISNGPRWFSVLNFRVVLRRLHDADIESESAEMYPRGVCKTCAEKYKFDRREGSLYAKVRRFGESGDRESLMKLSRENTMHDFWAHSSHMCEICSDLCDFEKPAKVEEMVREVERMRAKAAKRPPLRVVQGEDPPLDDGTSSSAAMEVFNAPEAKDCLSSAKDSGERARMLAMALKWLATADKIAIEFLKQFGVSLRQGKNPAMTPEFNSFRDELQRNKTRGRVAMIMRSIIGAAKANAKTQLEEEGLNVGSVCSNIQSTIARLRRFEQGTAAQGMRQGPPQRPPQSSPTRGAGRGRGRGRPPGSGRGGGTRTIVIDSKAGIANRRVNTGSLVIQPVRGQGPKKRLSPGALEQLKKGFADLLSPVSRVIRVDVVRYILSQEKQKRELLTRVGIKFNEERSRPLCFAGMDPVVLERCVNMISGLVDVQWAVVMAETIFKLVHPKDMLSLELAGITVDATNVKAPIALRLEHEMRQFFSRYPNGDNLAAHLVKKFTLEPIKAHVRAVDGLLRSGPTVAEAFIKEGKAAGKAAKKRKAPRGYAYVDDAGDDVDLMPPPPAPGKRAKLVTPSLLRKGGPKGRPPKEVKKKKKKLPRKRPSAGRSFNAKWVEDDDEDFDPEFGSVKIGSSSRGRGGAVSEAVAGARRPGRREKKFTSDEIKKFIEEAEEYYEDEFKISPPWMMEVKVERVKPPPPLQLNTNGSDPLGDESTLSDLATDASSEPIVIDPDSDSVEKAGNLNSSVSSSSSSMATQNNPPPGEADSIEVEENPIGSGDEQQTHRSEDDTVQSETAQETNAAEAEGAESSQQEEQQDEAPSTEIDDAGLSMPQFDEVMAEQPTVVTETEPSAAQDMPDVGAVGQVAMNDAVSAMDDASAAPDLSTEGITPMETDNSAAAAPAE